MPSCPGLFTSVIFDPKSISGLKIWYKSDSLSLANGTGVSTWHDSSGNSNDALQATSGNQPTFTTNVVGSLPGVLFDGTNSFMQFTNSSPTHPCSVLIVVQPSLNTASQHNYATMTHGTASSFFLVAKLSTSFWGTFGAADISSGNALTAGSNYLLENTADGANNIFLYQRGVQVKFANDSEVGSGDPGALGKDLTNSGRNYAGYIFEELVYSKILSPTERVNLENYLITKWSL